MIKKLISGFLVLTYDCNNRCRWCYASPSGFKKDLMDFDRIEGYLGLMNSLGIKSVGLLGGEPTLHPRLFDIIKIAKKLGLKVTLYTNGRRLNDEGYVKKLKESNLDFVNFSIQTGSGYARKHDKIVNVNGAWKETKKGIENCYKNGIKINIQTVLTHSNIRLYKEIIDEFYYANLFIFYREIPAVIPGCNFFKKKVFSNKKTKEAYKEIYDYAKEKEVRSYFFSRMPLCWWDEDDPTEKEISKGIVSHCHIINGSILAIDVDGNVLPCPQYINLHTMNLIKGRKIVSKDEFLKEYNSEDPEKLRELLKYWPHKKCESCEYFGTRCTGGCPLVKFDIGPYAPLRK